MNQTFPTCWSVRLWACATWLFLLAPLLLPAQQPRLSRTLDAGAAPVSLAFSADGKALASAGVSDEKGPGEPKLWDVATGKKKATLKGHAGLVWSVAFSPDGKSLASAGGRFRPEGGPGTGELRLWDVATGKNTATLESHPGVVICVAFSPDGKTLASSGGDGKTRLWEVATGKNLATMHTLPGFPGSNCVAFSPDGKKLAVGGGPTAGHGGPGVTGEVHLWDLATGKKTAILRGHPGEGCFSNMTAVAYSVAFSPDGKTLISGGARTIEVWEVATGKKTATFTQPHVVWRVALSPDGKTVAWVTGPMSEALAQKAGLEREVRLLDVRSGENFELLKRPAAGGWALVFSPDGRTLACGGEDGKIDLWDIPAVTKADK